MTAYYNEIDPFAVAWLRALIAEGVIADGIVDDRSIQLVEPGDLNGFTQCHFFAGIGVWSYALRRAGWPDDRPVWTGSCPCQPFSAAGKGEGVADPRHLWPAWFRLARVHRPDTIFGEQVERAIRLNWFDLVSTDMEGEGYAVGSTVFGSHSVGAPHQRQRLYFVADRQSGRLSDADSERRTRIDSLLWSEDGRWIGAPALLEAAGRRPARGISQPEIEQRDGTGNAGRRGRESSDGRDLGCSAVALGDAARDGREQGNANRDRRPEGIGARPELGPWSAKPVGADSASVAGPLGHPDIRDTAEVEPGANEFGKQRTKDGRGPVVIAGAGTASRNGGGAGSEGITGPRNGSDSEATRNSSNGLHDAERAGLERFDGYVDQWDQPRRLRAFAAGSTTPTGILSGFWGGAEWVECTDGKARPVEPGSFPLAYGSPARVGRLRGYGNAINAEAAKAFIEAYMSIRDE